MNLFRKKPANLPFTAQLEFSTLNNGLYKVTHKGVINALMFNTVNSGSHCVAVYHKIEFANGEVMIYRDTPERQLMQFKKEKN